MFVFAAHSSLPLTPPDSQRRNHSVSDNNRKWNMPQWVFAHCVAYDMYAMFSVSVSGFLHVRMCVSLSECRVNSINQRRVRRVWRSSYSLRHSPVLLHMCCTHLGDGMCVCVNYSSGMICGRVMMSVHMVLPSKQLYNNQSIAECIQYVFWAHSP